MGVAKALAAQSTSFAPLVAFDMTLEEAFPEADPGHAPMGQCLLIQYPSPKTKTKSGLYLADETRATIQANTQVVKVIAIGPVAFRNRETLQLWPEGAWCAPGQFVRVGKYGLDKWEVPLNPEKAEGGVAVFGLIEDLQLKARVTGDPLSIIAYV